MLIGVNSATLIGRVHPAPMVVTNTIRASFAGQSNAKGYFDSAESSGNDGQVAFEATLAEFYHSTFAIDGATNGSSLIYAHASDPMTDPWWYNPDTEAYGPAYDTWVSSVDGLKIDVIVWDQGESDFGDIGSDAGERALYKSTLLTLFNQMRSVVGGMVPIVIIPIGRRGDTSTNAGWDAIREVQQELAAENSSFIHLAPEKFDLALHDQVHLTDASYEIQAVRVARKVAAVLGKQVPGGVDGPTIISAVRITDVITLTIDHDGGTDFTPTTGIEGFVYTDDGVPIAITSAVRTNASTITLTLDSIPVGVEVLEYAVGTLRPLDIDYTNLVVDNQTVGLPLRALVDFTDINVAFTPISTIVPGVVAQLSAVHPNYSGATTLPNYEPSPADSSSQTTYDCLISAGTGTPTYDDNGLVWSAGNIARVGAAAPTTFFANLNNGSSFTVAMRIRTPAFSTGQTPQFWSCGGNNSAIPGVLLRYIADTREARIATSTGAALDVIDISGSRIDGLAEIIHVFAYNSTTETYSFWILGSGAIADEVTDVGMATPGVSASPMQIFNSMPAGAILRDWIIWNEYLSNSEVNDVFSYFLDDLPF